MLLAALAASSSVAAAQVPAKPVPPSPPPTPPPLLDQVEKVVTGPQFASSYGGDVLLSDGTITVYVTPAGLSNMQTALERTLGNASDMVSLRPVAHSFADLENLTSQIAADQASLAPSGITLSTWGPDPTSNTVRVAVLTDPSAADRVLGARYGSGRISVVQVPPSDTLIGLSNRYYDNAPSGMATACSLITTRTQSAPPVSRSEGTTLAISSTLQRGTVEAHRSGQI
jgi:hypothetical protein